MLTLNYNDHQKNLYWERKARELILKQFPPNNNTSIFPFQYPTSQEEKRAFKEKLGKIIKE